MFRSNLLGFHLCHMCGANASKYRDTTLYYTYFSICMWTVLARCSFKYLNVFLLECARFGKIDFDILPTDSHTHKHPTERSIRTHALICCIFHWLIAIYFQSTLFWLRWAKTIKECEKEIETETIAFGAPIFAYNFSLLHRLIHIIFWVSDLLFFHKFLVFRFTVACFVADASIPISTASTKFCSCCLNVLNVVFFWFVVVHFVRRLVGWCDLIRRTEHWVEKRKFIITSGFHFRWQFSC